MKNKKTPALLLALVLSAALLLSGCGGGAKDGGYTNGYAQSASSTPMEAAYDRDYAYEEAYGETASASSVSELIGAAAQVQQSETEKMIYTAYATLETLEFQKTTAAVQELLGRFGAYIESSSVSGNSYNSSRSSRSASYTIRVPVQNYTDMSVALAELGNVTSYSSNAENITSRFVDTEARLRTYRTEYDRLIEMLEAADDVESMIYIESRLSEVEYQIESLTSTLRDWQGRVDYSTIVLNVVEVKVLSEPVAEPETFGERVSAAFTESIEWLGEALVDIAIAIIAILPWLVIPAVIVVVIILLVKRHKKSKAKKAAKKAAAEAEAYAREAAEAAERAKAWAAAHPDVQNEEDGN